ncbi:hypothetical protein [Flavobacterium sp. SM2513]|uniref:hypothetical protein n=1 Tax=Flavobacterium sp. SM2513 TaxID=3424766 RepID=UPI003D7F3642
MKYRAQLIELILDDKEDAMMDWILSQPLMEQTDIFRELKQIAEEAALENGDDINQVVEGFDNFENLIEKDQEAILDIKLAEANYIMALEEQEIASDDILETFEGIRDYVIECITTNAPNADEMRDLAVKLIALEKDSGIYKVENWCAIL